ncbi:GNAT family N-acetyltransferase [Phyllobacterium leguminum]|uniref:GNAT family N-acetyltransferase n=1 Tax=Phyllobacterium leguminum TaxID=314237 RepID=UPI000DA13836|nr:GNAT family protein [Phyllobacterium leguminum]
MIEPQTDDDLLAGQSVRLIALDPDRHADQLFSASHISASNGEEGVELWRFMRDGPFQDADAYKTHLKSLCASKQFSGFAIVDLSSSALLGQIALMKADEEHRTVEIGYVLFLPVFQRTRGGTEALYLLMRYAFEGLKIRRCEWRCDSRNVKSERAALRLGFQREGQLRQHMIVKGRNRDTIILSLLDTEWENAKGVIETWLSDENFDEDGVAMQSLHDLQTSRRPQSL